MSNHRNIQSKVSFLNQDEDYGLPHDQNLQSNELKIKVAKLAFDSIDTESIQKESPLINMGSLAFATLETDNTPSPQTRKFHKKSRGDTQFKSSMISLS